MILHLAIAIKYYRGCMHGALYRGVGTSPAGPVLAGPLFQVFQGKNMISFIQKTINKQKCYSAIFRLVRLIILLYNR